MAIVRDTERESAGKSCAAITDVQQNARRIPELPAVGWPNTQLGAAGFHWKTYSVIESRSAAPGWWGTPEQVAGAASPSLKMPAPAFCYYNSSPQLERDGAIFTAK